MHIFSNNIAFHLFQISDAVSDCGDYTKKNDCKNSEDNCEWDKNDNRCVGIALCRKGCDPGYSVDRDCRCVRDSSNIDCGDYTNKNNCNADDDCEWDTNGDGGNGECIASGSSDDDNRKTTASEKRQMGRDKKRSSTNKDRTQEEENKERGRKSKQAANNDDREDPYDKKGFDKKREAKRLATCEQ